MLTEKYDFRITDQMTIPLRPHSTLYTSLYPAPRSLILY